MFDASTFTAFGLLLAAGAVALWTTTHRRPTNKLVAMAEPETLQEIACAPVTANSYGMTDHDLEVAAGMINAQHFTPEEATHLVDPTPRKRRHKKPGTGKPPMRVAQISPTTGRVVARYSSQNAAARATGIRQGNIAHAVAGGYKMGGYYWRRCHEFANRPRAWKAVEQRTLTGELVAMFPSHTEAAQRTGLHRPSITRAVNEGIPYKGFRWIAVEAQ